MKRAKGIDDLLKQGFDLKTIMQVTGCARRTVYCHKQRLGLTRPVANGLRLKDRNWSEIQAFYDAGAKMYDCLVRFGMSNSTWAKAVRLGLVRSDPKRRRIASDTAVFCEDSKHLRHVARRRLLQDETLLYLCSICGQRPEWNGQTLVLVLDHKNGVKNDHRRENLRWVCPNYNSQLPTFCSRNLRFQRHRATVQPPNLSGHIVQDGA